MIDTGAATNIYGDAPFTTLNDFSTPNEAYFAQIDYVITQARARGILVVLFPAYLGYDGGSEGWYSVMQANGVTKLRAYGNYVANRFKAHDNILWANGGDYNPPDKSLTEAVAQGIRDILPNALQTAHCKRGTAALDYWGGEPWLNVNTTYVGDQPHGLPSCVDSSLAQYQKTPVMPYFLVEAYYENENNATIVTLRRQAYGTVFSGAFGQFFGNNPVWHFGKAPGQPTNWKGALNSPGARSMTLLWNLVSPSRWDLLAPDTNGSFLTGGALSGDDRAAAALASDGSIAFIYAPTRRTMSVNLSRMSGPNVSARWYDPSNGTYTAITGSPLPAVSTSFTMPTANADGSADWVLVLQSV